MIAVFVQGTTFFTIDAPIKFEKGIENPIKIHINPSGVDIADIYVQFKDGNNNLLFSKTINELQKLDTQNYKTEFTIPERFENGEYYLSVEMEEKRFPVRHEETLTIQVKDKGFWTYILELEEFLRFKLRWLNDYVFGS